MLNYQQAFDKLNAVGQTHVLKYFNEISDNEKECLLTQIESCDTELIGKIMQGALCTHTGEITPIEVLTHNQIKRQYDDFENAGINAILQGKVAALLLAGGQGSRLGFDHSKGMFDIGLSRELFIFECLFNNVLKLVKKVDCWIPFCIMTSKSNNNEIKDFLLSKNYFGYSPEHIYLFIQDELPSVDFEGKYLMSSKSSLSLSPDGNGGWFSSLEKSGILAILRRKGIEWINVFSIENVLQKIADPLFIGATLLGGFSCGAKVVSKVNPKENVGIICNRNDRPSIIEYYELADEIAYSKDSLGNLLYNYGVILNYLFNIDKVKETTLGKMRIHSAKKKIQTIGSQGQPYIPEKENGYKPETLILDMVEIIGNCLPFEVIREKEFAPIKCREGADSIVSARELLVKNGIDV